MVAERIERRWLLALVAVRDFADSQSDSWRRTARAIDLGRDRLTAFVEPDALATEYIAVVLGRRIRLDDLSTQPSPFVRDASFALRYVEIRTGTSLSTATLPSWLGEWAVSDR